MSIALLTGIIGTIIKIAGVTVIGIIVTLAIWGFMIHTMWFK